MSWFLIILFLNLVFNSISEGRRHEYESISADIIGSVYCEPCFQKSFSQFSHSISGAVVAAECKDGRGGGSKLSYREEVKTDENGGFRIRVPFSVTKHVNNIETCSVRLIKSSDPDCAIVSTSTSTSSSLKLEAREKETYIFTSGFLSFKPIKQPSFCSPEFPELSIVSSATRKSRKLKQTVSPKTVQNSDQNVNQQEFLFPPLIPNPLQPPPLIPNPFQPPPLIPNPLQPPPAPIIPNPFQPPPAPFIPNPFQPPSTPTPLIPNPFQPPPTPTPTPLIPNPFQPPSAPAPLFPHLPPFPGFTPSPSPPPPPASFFPPIPHIPGIPPAPHMEKQTSP